MLSVVVSSLNRGDNKPLPGGGDSMTRGAVELSIWVAAKSPVGLRAISAKKKK